MIDEGRFYQFMLPHIRPALPLGKGSNDIKSQENVNVVRL